MKNKFLQFLSSMRRGAAMLLLLVMCVTHAWADDGDFYNMYLSYTFEGADGAVDGSDNNTGVSVDAGTLTSGSLILTGVYLKCWDDWGDNYKSCGGQLCYTNKGGSTQYISCSNASSKNGNNYEWQNSNPSLTIASYDQASGSYAFESWGQTWGCDGHTWGDRYFPKSSGHYTINYKIAPPAVSGFTITPSGAGYVSGTGTEDDPYIMKHDAGNLVLTISGSQAHTDANSSAKYYNGSSWSATASKTIYYASGSTTKQSITLKMKYNNSTASLDGAVSERTVWYQQETAYNVRATANPSAGGNPTPSSLTATGQYSGISITAPANTGYTFSTWSIVSGGAGTFGSAATTASNTFYPTKATDLKATFTAKNYTVKLSKNGGDTDGTVTTTYNSTSTASFTGATYAGHSCDGYFTAKSGGSKILNADGTLPSSSVASYLSSGNWVGDTVTILYAQWTEDVTNYTVNYGVYSAHTSYGTLSCATTVGGTAVSSGGEVASGTNITFTASPISGYEVDAWYRNSSCTSAITEAGYANTFAPTITKDTTVYVKFKKKIYTVTYSPSSAPTGCTYTTKPTTGTYGNTVTMVITPSTGYTVSVSARDASSNVVTISNPSANTYTFTQPASAVTVTVSTSQIMSSLSTSCHYDVGNPSYAVPSKSASSIGIATTANLSATAPETGYTFVGWTLTHCVRTSGEANSRNITVRSDGSGEAASAVANYEEVLTTGWKIIGQSTSDKANSPFSNWNYASSTQTMSKASGHSTESVVYATITVAAASVITTDDYYEFKVASDGSTFYGYGTSDGYYILFDQTKTNQSVYCNSNNDHALRFKPNVAGNYTFKVDYSSTPKTVTVTFPTSYTLTYAIGDVKGTNGTISTSPTTASGSKVLSGNSVTLTAPDKKTGYSWSGWFTNAAGTEGQIADDNRAISVTMDADKTLYACYTINNHAITHSAASHGSYTIKVGDAAAVSTNTTSDYGKTITLAASPSTGYHFGSWAVTQTTGGASVTVTNNQFTMPDAAVTVAATFTANSYSVSFNGNGSDGGDAMSNQAFTYDVAQNLSENTYTRTGYTFDGWATSAGGTVAYTDEQSVSNLTATNGATFPLFAHWNPNTYTVTLDYDETGLGTDGGKDEVTATYAAAMPAMGTAPVGAAGYKFRGYFTGHNGGGIKYYNADGTSAHTWDIDGDTTLYAYFEKAEIATLPLSATIVHPWVSGGTMDSITVTPTLSFDPEPTVLICYEIQYSDGSAVTDDGLQTFRNLGDNSIRFRAPKNPGSYRVHAELKTTNCSGSVLDTKDEIFVVAASHNVTVKYVCDGKELKESEVKSINALDSVSLTAPDIDLYTFSEWEMTTGINSNTGSSVNPKKFVATYDGIITVKYVETPIVYFVDNLGWGDVYITYDSYMDDNKDTAPEERRDGGIGSGSYGKTYRHMTQIEGTNIWYDVIPTTFTENGFARWPYHVAFNDKNLNNYKHFNEGNVVFRRDFDRQTLMFVPTKSDSFDKNGAKYYSSSVSYYEHKDQGIYVNLHTSGYWKRYNSTYSGYSLRGEFNSWAGSNHNFVSENDGDSIFSTTVKLEKNTSYYFRVYRNTVGRDNEGFLTYSNESTPITLTRSIAAATDTIQFNRNAGVFTTNCKMQAATEGEYKFSVYFKHDGTVWVTVDYPTHAGDYQVLYKDNVHTAWHPAGTIDADATKNITSFFVRKKQTPVIKWRKVSSITDAGAITWGGLNAVDISSYQSTGKVIASDATGVDTTGVYNFHFNIAGGNMSLTNVDEYTGQYYIRTNSANIWKWEHYTDGEHTMTYSDYADAHNGFSHYFMRFVGNGTNVKFTVANDYSPCISDTLDQGSQSNFVDEYDNLIASANIRYSWNMHNNSLDRAYVGMVDRTHTPRQATRFIVLQGQDTYIKDKDEKELNEANQGTMFVGDDAIEFDDDENWIYETTVKAMANGRIKIYSRVNGHDYYLIGDEPLSGVGAWETSNSDFLITGTGAELQSIRVIYDFKTGRLMAAWLPTGTIENNMTLKADIMIRRTHQGNADQFNIASGKSITLDSETNKTVYGVMRFNKYELNNLNANGTPKDVPLPPAELSNYYISFPFDVKVSDIFGFGSYGPDFTLRYYDGKGRAKNGYWADSNSFWKYVPPFGTLNANEGYLLSLNMNRFGTDAAVWNNGVENIELYFPASSTVNIAHVNSFDIAALDEEYYCSINRGDGTDGDRRVKDSYWRCIGVPSFAAQEDLPYNGTGDAITWKTSGTDLPFLYQVNWSENGLTPVSATTFTFQPMHAYMVQNGNKITWTNVSTSVAAIVARERGDYERQEREFRLELNQNDEMKDQTFVRLTNHMDVTTDFDFNQDLSKEFNEGANIYTLIGYEKAAANSLPLTDQTTIVPVGVKISTNGEYTFAMPDGTNGVSVILIDNIAGTRTNLGLLDYTVYLEAGQTDGRFSLEIASVQQITTNLEAVNDKGLEKSGARKVLIDGILYIVKDGEIYDAQGRQIK